MHAEPNFLWFIVRTFVTYHMNCWLGGGGGLVHLHYPVFEAIAPGGTENHCLLFSYVSSHHYMCDCLLGGGGAMAEWVRVATGRLMVRVPLREKNFSLRNFGNSVYPACQCLSDETVKAVGPFYLVSMPGEVKDPTSPHWNV